LPSTGFVTSPGGRSHVAGLPWRDRMVLTAARLWLGATHPLMMARFWRKLGYFPNPAVPVAYPEKMLWRKLVDRNPYFVTCTDKLATKPIVAERAPGLPLVAVLWSGTDIAAAPPEVFGSAVMVKANNGCGANIRVENGSPPMPELIGRTRKFMRSSGRKEEWAYSQVPPSLLIEPYVQLGGGDLPTDIKVYVVCGETVEAWACDKRIGRSLTLDASGNALPGRDSDYPREDQALPHSPRLAELVRHAAELAPRLAGDVDFLRVDFLVEEKGLLAGELTVYSGSGYERLANQEVEAHLTTAWDLRQSHFLRTARRGLARLYADALRAAEARRLGE